MSSLAGPRIAAGFDRGGRCDEDGLGGFDFTMVPDMVVCRERSVAVKVSGCQGVLFVANIDVSE
jgi:hypothetical protein